VTVSSLNSQNSVATDALAYCDSAFYADYRPGISLRFALDVIRQDHQLSRAYLLPSLLCLLGK
jgi:hypothetical protein